MKRCFCALLVVLLASLGCQTVTRPPLSQLQHYLPDFYVLDPAEPVVFGETEEVGLEGTLYASICDTDPWTRDSVYRPPFYEGRVAPPGYLQVALYWPSDEYVKLELLVGGSSWAEPGDFTEILWLVLAQATETYLLAVQSDFDEAQYEALINDYLQALDLHNQNGRPYRSSVILLGYDISWGKCHYRSEQS